MLGEGAGMFCGESGFSLSSPFTSQREGDRPRRGPTPNPTITHTPGAPPRAWAGRVQACGCRFVFDISFVLYGDFLVCYTIREDKVLEILMSFV